MQISFLLTAPLYTSNLGAIIETTIRARIFKKYFEELGKIPLLLDLGCGARPYMNIYAPYCEKTIGADLPDSPFAKHQVDIFCNAAEIGQHLDKDSIDVVFTTEVMQDMDEPSAFLHEIRTVLKPRGVLIMTTPFMVPIADGIYDHYRFTKYGLQHLLEKQGFVVQKITPVADLFGSIITFLTKPQLKFWNALAKSLRLKLIYSLVNPFIFLFVFLPQALYLQFYFLSRRIKLLRKLHEKFSYGAIGYVTYAVKP